MFWGRKSDAYQMKARLHDKDLQDEIERQNRATKSGATVEVYRRYEGRDGPWFVVQVPGDKGTPKPVVLFHGLDQAQTALDLARELDKAYDRGVQAERRRVMGVVATP